MKKLFLVSVIMVLAGVLILGGCAKPAPAPAPTPTPAPTPAPAPTGPIKLTFGACLPAEHPFSRADLRILDNIKEQTNGKVDFEVFWAGSLIQRQEAWAEVCAGVADFGDIGRYSEAGFPITTALSNCFYGIDDMRTQLLVYDELRAKYPQLDNEYKDAKVLGLFAFPPFQIHSVKIPISKLSDLKGLVIRSDPGVVGPFQKLGAEPIIMPSTEIYTACEKGMVDGLLTAHETLLSYRFAEVTQYSTDFNVTFGPSWARAMNWETWNSLPPDVQEAFEDNMKVWSLEQIWEVNREKERGIAFAMELGHEFLHLSPEEVNAWYDLLKANALEQVAKLDAQGIPGTEMFNDARSLIEKYSL